MRLALRWVGLFLAFIPGWVAADGMHFFSPPDHNATLTNPDALVYVGNIKDTGGRYVNNVRVFVRFSSHGASFPARNDRPGHYVTPDINALAKSIGATFKPEEIKIELEAAEYELARPPIIPRRDKGRYSVDLLVKPRNH